MCNICKYHAWERNRYISENDTSLFIPTEGNGLTSHYTTLIYIYSATFRSLMEPLINSDGTNFAAIFRAYDYTLHILHIFLKQRI